MPAILDSTEGQYGWIRHLQLGGLDPVPGFNTDFLYNYGQII